MNDNKIILTHQQNIRQALKDYRAHTDLTDVLDDISDKFIRRLAIDSFNAKSDLRSFFSASPAWNEELSAIVINGTCTHNPDFELIHDLAHKILNPVKYDADFSTVENINRAIHFFSSPDQNFCDSISAIQALAPKAYAPNKKRSRIFMALCNALGASDKTAGSEFQKLFAQFADELSARKINFKLFVSINPAHFLTMSNPKDDKRGCMLTSCHSLNSTDYSYNCGCTGYARDPVTFIVFTVADPDIPELLNNRKTTRQLFMYKPFNGLLLQSRLYNTHGGTSGAQAESKLYRDLIQREIANLEHVPNLWKTFSYCGNEHCHIDAHPHFGGYTDWKYKDFDAKISIRADHEYDFQTFEVGTHGLCICCGTLIDSGLYCHDCCDICEDCGEPCSERYGVYNFDNEYIQVCERCFDNYYSYCSCCDEYHHMDDMTRTGYQDYVCSDCLENYYSKCDDCEEYYTTDDMCTAVNRHGDEILICNHCRQNNYLECDECGRYVHRNHALEVHDCDGQPITICPDCRDNACYEECIHCGEIFHEDALTDGVCFNCATKKEGAAQ